MLTVEEQTPATPSPRPLQGKVIVVTGAGQGIGRAYAADLGRRGCELILTDINAEKGQSVKDELISQGVKARFIAGNVADEKSCAALADLASEYRDGIDGLVNNAAIFSSLKMKPHWELSVDEWDAVMAVNLRGVWLTTKALRPSLAANGGGSIVNISSGVVWMGKKNYAHYVASKAGVLGLSRALARELGDDNIRVNALTPGAMETEVPRETKTPAEWEAMIAEQCIKRRGTPRDLVGVVAFLLSDDSAFITGQAINVDGGYILH